MAALPPEGRGMGRGDEKMGGGRDGAEGAGRGVGKGRSRQQPGDKEVLRG